MTDLNDAELAPKKNRGGRPRKNPPVETATLKDDLAERLKKAEAEVERLKEHDVVRYPPRPEAGPGVPNPSDPNLKRFRIILENSPNMPAKGSPQFFCANGYTAWIKPGVEVKVPEAIINILNDCIEEEAITDPVSLQVVEYRSRLRFPYRLLGPA